MTFQLNLEQLRKQAKERVRERRARGQDVKLAEVQFELARELGFQSWPKLKAYVERLALEQPFRTDLDYYEGRADGIATVNGVSVAEARRDLAARHGFASWRGLRRHVEAMSAARSRRRRSCSPTGRSRTNDRERLVGLLDRFPDLVVQRGTNGNDLLGMAGDLAIVSLLLERGADPNRGNDYGWTKLHQAGYGNDRELAQVDARRRRAHRPVRSRRRRHAADPGALLGSSRSRGAARARTGEPAGRRRARRPRADPRRSSARRQAGAHRGFYRPHGGFPAWQPSDDPRRCSTRRSSGRRSPTGSRRCGLLVELGARVDADPYRGTALTWAAVNGRVDSIRTLVELGADPNQRGTFGGPSHGEGVTAIHLAAQAGQREAVVALLELGADRSSRTSSTAATRSDGHARRPRGTRGHPSLTSGPLGRAAEPGHVGRDCDDPEQRAVGVDDRDPSRVGTGCDRVAELRGRVGRRPSAHRARTRGRRMRIGPAIKIVEGERARVTPIVG